MHEGGEALKEDLRFWVYEAQKDSSGKRREITNSAAAQPLFKLPAGSYYIWVRHGNVNADTDVALTAGERKKVTLTIKQP